MLPVPSMGSFEFFLTRFETLKSQLLIPPIEEVLKGASSWDLYLWGDISGLWLQTDRQTDTHTHTRTLVD